MRESDHEKIKLRILKIGIAIPGTIRETYLICGKENCKCAQSEEERHGPYYFWNRKVGGKLTSKSISPKQLSQYKEWIANRKHLQDIIEALLIYGLEYATRFPNHPSKEEAKSQKRKKQKAL